MVELSRGAAAASLFLDAVSRRLPFPLRALPVDGGSEFAALFAQACQQYGLRPLVLRPRSPTLNARAERGHRMYQALGYLNPQ